MPFEVITPEILASLEAWKAKFKAVWTGMPEGFFDNWRFYLERYRMDFGSQINPVNTPWFKDLVARGTTEDLDAVYKALSTRPGEFFHIPCGYQDFFMHELLWKANDARCARPVRKHTIAIPKWFRSRYMPIGGLWECEVAEEKEKATGTAVVPLPTGPASLDDALAAAAKDNPF